MDKKLTGKTYDIQGFSVHDGPGIRTTVFLKGCPLRCPWCHSPESQEFKTELNWMKIRCLGLDKCGKCLGVCPHGCVSEGPEDTDATGAPIRYPKVDKTLCDECGKCADACKAEALYMCGDDKTIDEVMYRLLRDKPFFDTSGGGVTVSGGECLSQPDFTFELLRRCKEAGINTAVDTTGFVKWEVIERVLPYTDLFLYDLKCMDSKLHEQVIGVPNELILDNCRRIGESGGKLQIRIPTIPLFNDTVENMEKTGEFLNGFREAVELIQLLPYHTLGVSKYDRLLKNEKIFVAEPPSDAKMEKLRAVLVLQGYNVIIH